MRLVYHGLEKELCGDKDFLRRKSYNEKVNERQLLYLVVFNFN